MCNWFWFLDLVLYKVLECDGTITLDIYGG